MQCMQVCKMSLCYVNYMYAFIWTPNSLCPTQNRLGRNFCHSLTLAEDRGKWEGVTQKQCTIRKQMYLITGKLKHNVMYN